MYSRATSETARDSSGQVEFTQQENGQDCRIEDIEVEIILS